MSDAATALMAGERGAIERPLSLWLAAAIVAGLVIGVRASGLSGALPAPEAAVAVATRLFGLGSGVSLAAVGGPPVMPSLVALANRTRRLFPDGDA